MRPLRNLIWLANSTFAGGLAMAQTHATSGSTIGAAIPVLRQDTSWSAMDWVRWSIVLLLLVLAAFVAWKLRRTGSLGLPPFLKLKDADLQVISQLRVDANLTVYVIRHGDRQYLIAAGNGRLVQLDPSSSSISPQSGQLPPASSP